ncbi:MAG: PilZ domain-containing protein [Acidobacteria bacterium]|nr:PilZ domain-containing protein [Acidobacteriaceae bacterium]MBV9610309.1 PilZ domain-containing protein [Acidobacteriota bacterium]
MPRQITKDTLIPEPAADVVQQRRWRRFHYDLPIRLVVQGAHRTEVVGRGCDLSEGGIAVHAPIDMVIGDFVEIEFSPTYSAMPVRVRAIVRNRYRYVYGLEFMAKDAVEQERIDLVGQLLRGASDFREA